MGDWFQSVVDTDASEIEAPQLGADVVHWLVSEGIVRTELTDCVLGSDQGHPPGPQYEKAVDTRNDNLLELWTNGVEVIAKRNVFAACQGGLELFCTACSHRFAPGDEWARAVGEWYEMTGSGRVRCPCCGRVQTIDEWEHDPPWGFGNLGFTFWNWPPLKKTFVKQIADCLKHQVVLVFGKL